MTSPKKYPTIIATLVLVIISLILFSLNFKSPGKPGFFKKIVLEMVVPLEHAIGSVFNSIGGAWGRYVLLVGLESETRDLNAKVASLMQEINEYREISLECMRLRQLITIKDTMKYPTVAARVVGRNRLSVFRTVLIDRGTADGIETNFPVIAAGGVVGRVIEVSWNASKVLLLVDYNS
ncbi:MAG TPA: rod shape-determining protein MreC, partial [Syntrophales bacterium]|nr:rod shape-determining protein MreC [Syntrophales bacterium]